MVIEEISEEKFSKIVESNELVIVDMYADWCYPCKVLSPIIEELSKEFKKVKFIKVNVDQNTNLALKFNVSSIPTLLFFKRGELVNRIVGALSKSKLKEIINSFI